MAWPCPPSPCGYLAVFTLVPMASCLPLSLYSCLLLSTPTCCAFEPTFCITGHSHPSGLSSKVTCCGETSPDHPVPTSLLCAPLTDSSRFVCGNLVCFLSVFPERAYMPSRTDICVSYSPRRPRYTERLGSSRCLTKYVLQKERWVSERSRNRERRPLSGINWC